jgi:hypothetical protein
MACAAGEFMVRYVKCAAFCLLLMCCVGAAGKDKKKVLLPDRVLEAKTVLVLIDPQAGVAAEAPFANQTARDDVEKALMKWGRFELANDVSNADLVILIRKGSGKIARTTIGGLPTNNRPVIFEPTDSGGRGGVSHGTPPAIDPNGPQPAGPTPQVEVGDSQDNFEVHLGNTADPAPDPLSSPPVWRYNSKDALRSPSVPAVDEFRKVIVEAEKQRANRP